MFLIDAGANPVHVYKIASQLLEISYNAAVDKFFTCPQTVKSNIEKEEAVSIKSALENAGASVEIIHSKIMSYVSPNDIDSLFKSNKKTKCSICGNKFEASTDYCQHCDIHFCFDCNRQVLLTDTHCFNCGLENNKKMGFIAKHSNKFWWGLLIYDVIFYISFFYLGGDFGFEPFVIVILVLVLLGDLLTIGVAIKTYEKDLRTQRIITAIICLIITIGTAMYFAVV